MKIAIGVASASALSVGTFFTIQQTISGEGVKTSSQEKTEEQSSSVSKDTREKTRVKIDSTPVVKKECTIVLSEIRDRVNGRSGRTRRIENPSNWKLKDFLDLKDVKKQDQKWVIGYNGRKTSYAELMNKLNSRCDELQEKEENERKIFIGSKFSFYYYLNDQTKYNSK